MWQLLHTRSGSRRSFRLRCWAQRGRCTEYLWLRTQIVQTYFIITLIVRFIQTQDAGSSEEKDPLTAHGERREVDGQVVLLAVQFAGVALQIVSMAGVLGHPLDLVATVGLCGHLRTAAL